MKSDVSDLVGTYHCFHDVGLAMQDINPLYSFRRFISTYAPDAADAASDKLLKSALILHSRITTFGPSEWNQRIIDGICSASSVKRDTVENVILDLKDHNLDPIEDVGPNWVIGCLESWASRPELGFKRDELMRKLSELSGHHPIEVYNTPLLGLFMSTMFGFAYHTDSDELSEMINYWGEINANNTTATNELEISLPPISDLDFDAIFELRRSPYINGFREFVYSAKKSDAGSEGLRRKIEDGLWNVVGSNKPRSNGSVWSRTLAAAPLPVPLPLPNPYGVYREIKEGKKERSMFKDLGWVWFIHEVREREKKTHENG